MEAKEKAKELVHRFDLMQTYVEGFSYDDAKQCALIAVDEIIDECCNWTGGTNDGWDAKRFDYWEEVKQEIKKL